MAHGIIPPFCGMLVSEALISELCTRDSPPGDLRLLGNAANEVLVTQEAAEAYFEILRQAKHSYLMSGSVDLRDADGGYSPEAQSILALLVSTVLGIDDARQLVAILRPSLEPNRPASMWKTAVNGHLRSRIQAVEEELGHIVKEDARDVWLNRPHEGGYERLERALAF